ncbi:DUF1559 family PulG-like putative transporter [Aureliella helgolandensis]
MSWSNCYCQPYTQHPKDARGMSCSNNSRQLGIASHN